MAHGEVEPVREVEEKMDLSSAAHRPASVQAFSLMRRGD